MRQMVSPAANCLLQWNKSKFGHLITLQTLLFVSYFFWLEIASLFFRDLLYCNAINEKGFRA